MSVFKLEPKDLPAIAEIERICFPEPWSEESFREILWKGTYQSLGAFDPSEQLVAYLIFREVLDELHILNVAVHPRHRRSGHASGLLRTAHHEASARGCQSSFLEVRSTNFAGQALYQSLGYQVLTRRKEYYANREDAILMMATLNRERVRR